MIYESGWNTHAHICIKMTILIPYIIYRYLYIHIYIYTLTYMHTYIIQPYDMKLTHFFKMHTAVEFTAWQQSKFHESLELPRFPFGHIISLVRWVATSPQQRKPKDFCWDVRWLEKVCKLGLKRSWPVWAIRPKKENNIEKIDMNGIYIYIYIYISG